MEIVSFLISLISGAVGGNLAGSAMTQKNLGVLVNTIAGLVGGALGGYILQAWALYSQFTGTGDAATTAAAAQSLDLSSILANIGAGGGSGAILTALITFIKGAMDKK